MFRFERKGMGSIPIEITVNLWILRDPFLFGGSLTESKICHIFVVLKDK